MSALAPKARRLAGLIAAALVICACVAAPGARGAIWGPVQKIDSSLPTQGRLVPGITCASASMCMVGGNLGSSDPSAGSASWHTIGGVGDSCPSVNLCVGIPSFGLDYSVITYSTDPLGSAPWSQTRITPAVQLNALSCPTTTLCVATTDSGVITSTDPAGGAWRITQLPDIGGLQAISCSSATFCAAVRGDEVVTSTDPTGGAGAWSVQATDPGPYVDLDQISCAGAVLPFCAATDSSGNVFGSSTPAAGGWNVVALGLTGIYGIACNTGPVCVVADGGDVVSSVNPLGAASDWHSVTVGSGVFSLEYVACPSAGFCAVTDQEGDVVTSTDPTGTDPGDWLASEVLGAPSLALSCPSASFCAAGDSLGQVLTSTAPTSDSWSAPMAVDSATTGNGDQAGLIGIACSSGSACVAVDDAGNAVTSTDPTTTQWTTTPIYSTAGLQFSFEQVACAPTGGCVVLGNDENVGAEAISSDDPTATSPVWGTQTISAVPLNGVSCPSATLCVAVGDGGVVATAPGPTGAWSSGRVSGDPVFNRVACPSASLCAATSGSSLYVSTDPAGGPGTWQSVASFDASLTTLACPSVTLCLAFEYSSGATNSAVAYIANPGSATPQVTPDQLLEGDQPTCGSATFCLATSGLGVIRAQLPLPPAGTSAPALSGTAQQGQTLTADPGGWNAALSTFTNVWEDCDASGASCTPIPGADGSTYSPQSSDVGETIRVARTATNIAGTASAASPPSAVVTPAAPTNTRPPSISGNAYSGQTLTEANGVWTGSPTAYAYQWQRCTGSPGPCAPIAGATAQSYVLTQADVGDYVYVTETASNAGGPGQPAGSQTTGQVQAGVPAAAGDPSPAVSGVPSPAAPAPAKAAPAQAVPAPGAARRRAPACTPPRPASHARTRHTGRRPRQRRAAQRRPARRTAPERPRRCVT